MKIISAIILLVIMSLPTHIKVALWYVGTTEKTGHNDGANVEMFLESVKLHKGDSWCAAFVSYCLTAADVLEPTVRTGLARSFKLKNSIKASDVLIGKTKVPDGSIVVWQKGTTVFGHVGFVREQINKKTFYTVEGNTSSGIKGSQANGDGVYERIRTIQPANYFRITSFTIVKERNEDR